MIYRIKIAEKTASEKLVSNDEAQAKEVCSMQRKRKICLEMNQKSNFDWGKENENENE